MSDPDGAELLIRWDLFDAMLIEAIIHDVTVNDVIETAFYEWRAVEERATQKPKGTDVGL